VGAFFAAVSAEMDDVQAATKFENLIHESLASITTQLNNYTHVMFVVLFVVV
jgi:hypothetical protein